MKTIYKTIAIFLLAGTGVDSAQAQNGSSQTWTLRQCIDYAIEHNINIRQTANEAEQNKVDVNTAKWAYQQREYKPQLRDQCTDFYRFTVIKSIFISQVES